LHLVATPATALCEHAVLAPNGHQQHTEDIPMRTSLVSAAAVAIGGYLLAGQVKKRRQQSATYYLDQAIDGADTAVNHMVGSAQDAMRRPGVMGFAAATALALGGMYLSKSLRTGPSGAKTVEESIDVQVPVSTAYNQWTQFKEFPKFMATVQEVRQIDDTHLHWRALVAGKTKEWDAEITEQTPDQRIAWRSTDGTTNAGVVTFHRVGDNRTRIMLQMDYEPETMAEKLGDAVGGVKLTAKGNLKRFKELVEQRGVETGAWRGTVPAH
jgi:uncharacterized membrane protein